MCSVDLKALNEKYPTCSTCAQRYGRKAKKAVELWCKLHNHPIEYVWYVDEKGRRSVVTDIPCADYQYLDMPTPLTLLFRRLRSNQSQFG